VLALKENSVLLVQRPADSARMAGMWELPEARAAKSADEVLAKFRHSITDTDYEVSVVQAPPALVRSLDGNARWFTRKQWTKLALTGLARKVLRKLVPESTNRGVESNNSNK
jgi:adenine-specific DNA glycosylase